MKTLRIILSIILALGGMLIFNESNSITPNFIGLACLALLVVINADKEALDKLQK
jgi:hypothetical protein